MQGTECIARVFSNENQNKNSLIGMQNRCGVMYGMIWMSEWRWCCGVLHVDYVRIQIYILLYRMYECDCTSGQKKMFKRLKWNCTNGLNCRCRWFFDFFVNCTHGFFGMGKSESHLYNNPQ